MYSTTVTIAAEKTFNKILNFVSEQIWAENFYVDNYLPPIDLIESCNVNVSLSALEWQFDETDNEEMLIEELPKVVKTLLCTNIVGVKKVCLRHVCTFAHYAEEWQPETCSFGNKCNNKNKCQRLHGKETKDEATKRLGIVFMGQKKYVNTRAGIIRNMEFKKSQK